MPQLEQLLSADDLAATFNIPVATLKYWRATRQGPPAVRVGRHVRYRPSDVELWLESQRIPAGDAA